jgi:tetratricopeptide (TPR) repeat protein
MSLINQVLNDLEKRGAGTNIGEATIRVVPLRQSHGTFWLFVAAISVSVLAASAWLQWGSEIQFPAAPVAIATAPAPIAVQPASQPVATVAALAEVEVPASGLNNKVSSVPKTVTLASKPLLILPPVIAAVSPNPAVSLGLPQQLTITGSHYASDAAVNLRTPKGRLYTNRKIVMQNSAQIVISANFRSMAGKWSVEVVNASEQSTAQSTSGEFSFAVQAAPVVAPVQDQAVSPIPNAIQSVAKPAPVETSVVVLPAGKVSKQPTQVTLQQQAENEFRKAYSLMQQGQIAAAISGYEAALQLDAGYMVARQTLVRLLLDNKRNADAEKVLLEGLLYDPKQHSLALLLARMQVGRNEIAQALETMQKSLPYAEKQADYQAFVAALLQRQNRHKEAIDYFLNAVKLNPQSGVWLMGLAISLRAEHRDAESRDAFNRALESHTLSAELQSFVNQQLKEL